ncbi:MAG TPA: hypothetical protein PLF26_15535 [Blastocatellia bacterium]|nr:hypothetical protein [Blastocatellia bacterium]
MLIDFDDIRHLIPGFVFNEYGQLTGNFVRREDIVCVEENGRIQVWLDREGFEARDPDRLICDYSAARLRGEES